MDDDDGKLKKSVRSRGSVSVGRRSEEEGEEEEVFSARVNLEPFHPPSSSFDGAGSSSNEGE